MPRKKKRASVKPQVKTEAAGSAQLDALQEALQNALGLDGETSAADKYLFQRLVKIEQALASHAGEVELALQQALDRISVLETRLSTLTDGFESHRHDYTMPMSGTGGSKWFDLNAMKAYVDDEKTIWDNWGVYLRAGSIAAGQEPQKEQTSKPL